MDNLTKTVRQIEKFGNLLGGIPPRHRGILFDEAVEKFLTQENVNRLEFIFSKLWAERNATRNICFLNPFLLANSSNPRKKSVPRTDREWEIVFMLAATFAQWLPTPSGRNFLCEGFGRGGIELTFGFPQQQVK